jgi:hypothetical protein
MRLLVPFTPIIALMPLSSWLRIISMRSLHFRGLGSSRLESDFSPLCADFLNVSALNTLATPIKTKGLPY